MKPSSVYRGFTLVEVLVVLTIIGLLAALIFPIFVKAREKARQAECASNMRQLSLAFFQYSQDYDQRFPCGVLQDFGTGYDYADNGWGGQLYPYVKSPGTYTCPDDATSPKTIVVDGINRRFTPVSYGFNANLGAGSFDPVPTQDPATGQPQNSVSKLTAPGKTVLLFEVSNHVAFLTGGQELTLDYHKGMSDVSNTIDDGGGCDGASWGTGVIDDWYMGSPALNCTASPMPSHGRHADAANYAFADGHVKWVSAGRISGGRNNASPRGAATSVGGNPLAEGTEFGGAGAHSYTFSAR